jgi:hypothetical protein
VAGIGGLSQTGSIGIELISNPSAILRRRWCHRGLFRTQNTQIELGKILKSADFALACGRSAAVHLFRANV